MYDLPSRTDVTQCIVDGSVVRQHVQPTLVSGSDGERRSA
jgi:ATP-dependent Clp protease ATP-binding subunit ClpX